jgi:hypothetical protein
MHLDPSIDAIVRQLAAAADANGPEARELADRLTPPLHAAIRLALLDVLSAAADELSVELAPGSVELRLRGGQPSFVVSGLEPPGAAPELAAPAAAPAEPPALEPDDARSARINVRMPDSLKARVEAAALREGRSVNAWLVRAATAALDGATPPPPSAPAAARPGSRGARRVTGWVT